MNSVGAKSKIRTISIYRMIDYSDELIIRKMPIECSEHIYQVEWCSGRFKSLERWYDEYALVRDNKSSSIDLADAQTQFL